MRRTLLVGAAVLSVGGGSILASGPAAARGGGQQPAVSVHPSTGYPATLFSVSFRAPDRTGTAHGQRRYYAVTATGPGSGQGCVSDTTRYAGASRARTRVRVTLHPGDQGWCVGVFSGTVTEQERPACPQGEPCPLYVVLLKTIGHFRFHVRAAPRGGDTTPPAFSGLQSAVTCTPGPERPGEMTEYHLSWNAARDDVTPRAQLVYDVYMSSTSGGEDFSQPTWTTSAGVTRFTTPAVPAATAAYFVVRARDQAGNRDGNKVERPGVNPCL